MIYLNLHPHLPPPKKKHFQHFHHFLPPPKKTGPHQPGGGENPSLKVILLQLLLALSDANGKPSVQGRAVQLGMSPTNCTVLPGGVPLFCRRVGLLERRIRLVDPKAQNPDRIFGDTTNLFF